MSDKCTIKFLLELTMVDGKICNALADSSGMRCYICRATISKMNNLEYIQNIPEQPETFQFGLSVLHAYIRFFECLLHIAYRLDIKTWKVKQADKPKLETRKLSIQNSFREKMGLIVDIPKPGFGTTNDGNTARRFFANPKLSSEITGINEDLIHKFGVILKTINSGLDINVNNFRKYCLDTAQKYVELYNWYYMPTSVHKILFHGASVINNAILPIGELSEEAQEAKNKDVKKFRTHFTRKSSREHTNEDLFCRLILSSDPYLSLQHLTDSRKWQFDSEILELVNVIGEDDTALDISSEYFSDSD